jgi:hypothetical protein
MLDGDWRNLNVGQMVKPAPVISGVWLGKDNFLRMELDAIKPILDEYTHLVNSQAQAMVLGVEGNCLLVRLVGDKFNELPARLLRRFVPPRVWSGYEKRTCNNVLTVTIRDIIVLDGKIGLELDAAGKERKAMSRYVGQKFDADILFLARVVRPGTDVRLQIRAGGRNIQGWLRAQRHGILAGTLCQLQEDHRSLRVEMISVGANGVPEFMHLK